MFYSKERMVEADHTTVFCELLMTRSVLLRLFVQLAAILVLLVSVFGMQRLWLGEANTQATWIDSLTPNIQEELTDFVQEWASARNWQTGQPVYDPLPKSIETHLGVKTPPEEESYIVYNAHPPTSVLLSLPLGRLQYEQAVYVWHALSAIALAGCIYFIFSGLSWRWHWDFLLPLLAVFSIYNPLRQQFNQGQWNTILLFLLCWAWWLLRKKDSLWAGVTIGLAVCIKLFPLIFVLFFLIWGFKRALLGSLVTILVIVLATIQILGLATMQEYLSTVLPALSEFRCSWLNQSVVGFWEKLFRGSILEQVQPVFHAPWLSQLLCVLTAIGLIGPVVYLTRRSSPANSFDIPFALVLVVMLLLGPVTWDHSLVLLFLPQAIATQQLFQIKSWSPRKYYFLLFSTLFFSINALGALKQTAGVGWVPEVAVPWFSGTILSVPMFILLGFAVQLWCIQRQQAQLSS